MRKLLFALLTVSVLLSLPGCMIVSYEDTNGPSDFSLQTLTDQDIIRGTNTSTVMSSAVTVNNKTVCKAQTMSGVVTLFEKRFDNEPLQIVVSCEITKGNARLILVIDDSIVHSFALNEDNQQFVLNHAAGKVCLKLAGETAGYTVTYELQ